uniref:Histone-lysine N-methyltransferase, H3 lysine-36 and H4 lysine-20 specific n=1 Tax=Cacopsylla melanoneura TaxID=428564 RepID=A0A8D8XI86_9HEMI
MINTALHVRSSPQKPIVVSSAVKETMSSSPINVKSSPQKPIVVPSTSAGTKIVSALNIKTAAQPILVSYPVKETKISSPINIKSSPLKPIVMPSPIKYKETKTSTTRVESATRPTLGPSTSKKTDSVIYETVPSTTREVKPESDTKKMKGTCSTGSSVSNNVKRSTENSKLVLPRSKSTEESTISTSKLETKAFTFSDFLKNQQLLVKSRPANSLTKVVKSSSNKPVDEHLSGKVSDPIPPEKDTDLAETPVSDPISLEKETKLAKTPVSDPTSSVKETRVAETPVSDPVSTEKDSNLAETPISEPLSSEKDTNLSETPVIDPISPEKDTNLVETNSSTETVDKKLDKESNLPNKTNESVEDIPETGPNLNETISSKGDVEMDNKSNYRTNISDVSNLKDVGNISDVYSNTVNETVTNVKEDTNQDDNDENYEDIEDSLVETPNPDEKSTKIAKKPGKPKAKRKRRFILSAPRRRRERKSVEQDVGIDTPVNDEVESSENVKDIETDSTPSTENPGDVDENSGHTTVSEAVNKNECEELVKHDVDTSQTFESIENNEELVKNDVDTSQPIESIGNNEDEVEEQKGHKGTSRIKKLTKRRKVIKRDSEILKIDNTEELDKNAEDTKDDTEPCVDSTSSSIVGSKSSSPSRSNKSGSASMKELLEKKTSMNEINIEEMYQQLINNCQSESSQEETSYSENYLSNENTNFKSNDSRSDFQSSSYKSEPEKSSEILSEETLENDGSDDVERKNDVKRAVSESPSKPRGRPRKYLKGEEPYLKSPHKSYLKAKSSPTNSPQKLSETSTSLQQPSPPGKRGRPRKILDAEGKPVITSPPKPTPQLVLTDSKRIIKRVVPFKFATKPRNPKERRGRPRKYPKGQEPSPIKYMKKYQLKRLKNLILTCQRSPKFVNSVEHENFRGFKQVKKVKAELSVQSEQLGIAKLKDLDSREDTTNQDKDSKSKHLKSSETIADPTTSAGIKETNTKSTDDETNDPDDPNTDRTEIVKDDEKSNKILVENKGETTSTILAGSALTQEVSNKSNSEDKSTEKVETNAPDGEPTDEKISSEDTNLSTTIPSPMGDELVKDSPTDTNSTATVLYSLATQSVDEILVQLRLHKLNAKQNISKDLKNLYSLRNISLEMKDEDSSDHDISLVEEADASVGDEHGVRKRGRPRKDQPVLALKRGRGRRRGGMVQIQLKKMKRIRVRKRGKKGGDEEGVEPEPFSTEDTKPTTSSVPGQVVSGGSMNESTSGVVATVNNKNQLKLLENNADIVSILKKNPDFEQFYMTRSGCGDKNSKGDTTILGGKTKRKSVKDVERRFWSLWFEWKALKPSEKKRYDLMSDSMSTSSQSSLTSSSAGNGAAVSSGSATTSTGSTKQFVKQREQGLLLSGGLEARICYLCLKGAKEGDLLRCKGRCQQTYHAACVRIVVRNPSYFATPKKKKKRKRASLVPPVGTGIVKRLKLEDGGSGSPVASDQTSIVSAQQEDLAPSLEDKKDTSDNGGSSHNTPSLHSYDDDHVADIDFLCHLCRLSSKLPCFICSDKGKYASQPKVKCQMSRCYKLYHEKCLTDNFSHCKWSNGTLQSCPCHVCHMCASENPTTELLSSSDKYLRCVRCPSTYHATMSCVPAGTKILSLKHALCPLHISRRNFVHFNTNWCFICTGTNESVSDTLLNCQQCPVAVHPECCVEEETRFDDDNPYLCDDCKGGRFPLYGEVVWVRYGHFRWWPGQILFPEEIPDNLISKCEVGVFVVYFFGTRNYAHICKGQAYVFEEGDDRHSQVKNKEKKRELLDDNYVRGLEEAAEAFAEFQRHRDRIRIEEMTERTSRPSKYVKIKTNKPVGNVRVEVDKSSTPVCECDPHSENPCGFNSNCINRDLYVECDPESCPSRVKCRNQDFEKRNYPQLEVFNTQTRGWGLKATEDLHKGQFVVEYVGEMIDQEELNRRRRDMDRNNDHNYYFLSLNNSRYIDAGAKGNLARFMNHSCEPNCTAEKWTVSGDTRVGLFTLKDIPAGTELVFNYELQKMDKDGMRTCMCGSERCSGFIGAKKQIAIESERSSSNGKDTANSRKLLKLKAKRRNRRLGTSTQGGEGEGAGGVGGEGGGEGGVESVKCSRCGETGTLGPDMIRCNVTRCRLSYHRSCIASMPSSLPPLNNPTTTNSPTTATTSSSTTNTTIPSSSSDHASQELSTGGTQDTQSSSASQQTAGIASSISHHSSTTGSQDLGTAMVSEGSTTGSETGLAVSIVSSPSTPAGDLTAQGKWICPLHKCLVCRRGYVIRCKYCNSSYCKEHRDHLCYDISSPFKPDSATQHGANEPGSLDSSLSLTEREKRTLRRNCGVTSKEELDNYMKIVQSKDQLLDHPVEKDSADSVGDNCGNAVGRRKSATTTTERRNSRNASSIENENSLLPARRNSRNVSSTENSLSARRRNSRNMSTENSSLDGEIVSQKHSLLNSKTLSEGNDACSSSLNKLGDHVNSGREETSGDSTSDVPSISDENISSRDENSHAKNPSVEINSRTEIESQENIPLTSSSVESVIPYESVEFRGKHFRASSIGRESGAMTSIETYTDVSVVIECDILRGNEDKLESRKVTKGVKESSQKKRKSVKKDRKEESEKLDDLDKVDNIAEIQAELSSVERSQRK